MNNETFQPAAGKYFFEKTEISEIAPRPTNFTFDLLKLIYSQNGPVSLVYNQYHIDYHDTNFLQIFGNELFVDKEKEIQGLLPAYSYLQNENFYPKFCKFKKIFSTIKNLFFLNNIKTKNYEEAFRNLKTRLESTNQAKNFQDALNNFLTDYQLIFQGNLLAGLAMKKLNLLLKKNIIELPDILNGNNLFIDLNKYPVTCPQNLKGNSLEISDDSDFVASEEIKSQTDENDKLTNWWRQLPNLKKKMLGNKITEAIIYSRLRELGRWLTVKNMNHIKKSMMDLALAKNFTNPKHIYFSSIIEIANGQIDESVCENRKNIYAQYHKYCLPTSITSIGAKMGQKKLSGVSAGLAKGILQNSEYLESAPSGKEKYILYTEILSPNLTKYFNKISGVVSHTGSLLSHLVIVAREKNIPVIVGLSLPNSDFKLGDYVEIDGSKGEIKKYQ